mmetsp:Transcript_28397/g.46009  ORF Transcript_28397/g.46009 Transcript_28397/m.46009 type:complete len:170 (-) Transcript_28397:102-611(-)
MQKIASESQTIELSKSKGAPAGSAKGILTIPTCQVVKVPSCLEYIAGGCEISLIVAIDFTASNGPPSSPDSLHFNTMGGRNQYQRAILAVGEILANYDTDKLIPAYGFGAQLPPAWNVSHCFALMGNPLHVRAQTALVRLPASLVSCICCHMSPLLSSPALFSRLLFSP